MSRKLVFAANWKMNKAVKETAPFACDLLGKLKDVNSKVGYEVVVAPPATHLTTLIGAAKGTPIQVSAQNCGTAKNGAFTGEISPVVLQEIGCRWVILGHSERRHVYKETDQLIAERLKAALTEKMVPIFCVGELITERKANETTKVVDRQLSVLKSFSKDELKDLVIAYEPVWAIGTGEVATPEQAEEVHLHIRSWLSSNLGQELANSMRILYGGSVKADNASAIMAKPNVDGLLVGGASLEANSFFGVIANGLKGKE